MGIINKKILLRLAQDRYDRVGYEVIDIIDQKKKGDTISFRYVLLNLLRDTETTSEYKTCEYSEYLKYEK